jgi:hypothetical protein
LKRHASLDIISSASQITEEKYFLANEKTNAINITRIRTSFEWLFPKFIVHVPEGPGIQKLKVRYCLLSLLIFCYLLFALVSSVFYSISNRELDSDLITIVMLTLVFLLFSFIEFNLTKRKIRQAIGYF